MLGEAKSVVKKLTFNAIKLFRNYIVVGVVSKAFRIQHLTLLKKVFEILEYSIRNTIQVWCDYIARFTKRISVIDHSVYGVFKFCV